MSKHSNSTSCSMMSQLICCDHSCTAGRVVGAGSGLSQGIQQHVRHTALRRQL
jgi:hypothetical protein